MWRRVDQLKPAVALGIGAAVGAAVWWAVAAVAPGLAGWTGAALLVAAVVLAFTGGPVAAPEPRVAAPLREPSATVVQTPTPVVEPAPTAPMPPGIDTLETYRFAVVTVDERGAVRERHEAEARSFAEDLGDGVRLDMTFIPSGRFVMGSPKGEASDFVWREDPQHEVQLGPFYLGRFPVTQAQWRVVARWPKVERELECEPSDFKGDDRPVERVRWNDAVEFCRRLSARKRRAYALPSEAQWEYACRAGTTTPFHFGPTITPELVNYSGLYPNGAAGKGEHREQTTPVGSFGVANAFGLFDMHGNVWEWCQDVWHSNYNGAPADGCAWEARRWRQCLNVATLLRWRVLRGGAWNYHSWICRSAVRYWVVPEGWFHSIGFRVVCAVSRTQ